MYDYLLSVGGQNRVCSVKTLLSIFANLDKETRKKVGLWRLINGQDPQNVWFLYEEKARFLSIVDRYGNLV